MKLILIIIFMLLLRRLINSILIYFHNRKISKKAFYRSFSEPEKNGYKFKFPFFEHFKF